MGYGQIDVKINMPQMNKVKDSKHRHAKIIECNFKRHALAKGSFL